MLGHKLGQVMSKRFETHVTLRDLHLAERYPEIFSATSVIDGVDALDAETVLRAFSLAKPTVVVNAVGVVKQLDSSKDAITSISINSLFPHKLAELCAKNGARLITISTDCVFSGGRGNYAETDRPDPEDMYGQSKLLGEVQTGNCLTIRTSIIGRQIHGAHALLEWFLKQQGGRIQGYEKAIFTGWPTLELSNIISDIVVDHKNLSGLIHVASEPISKFDLLSLIRDVYGLTIDIEPDQTFRCDRSLNAENFRTLTGMRPKPWKELVAEMFEDQAPYPVPAQLSLK